MTDDLVGRLRRDGLKYQTDTFDEAAARIEALEGALRRIAEMHRGKPAHDIARAALTPEAPHAD